MRVKAARSLLFVPAIAPRMLAGAAARGADAVIVDLEDSVPAARKAEARAAAAPAIEALAQDVPVLVRVNAGAWQDDIAGLPLAALAGVLLPKVEAPEQVQQLAAALAARCAAPPPIAALVESALGVLRSERIAQAAPALCALGFGAEDFAADLGVAPQPASLLLPAQQVALAGRAYGLACWGLADSIAEIEDMQAFAASAVQARALGFTGTVCIHPRQVAAANAGFGPTAEELCWANEVLAAAQALGPQGQGAFEFRGRMVDRPILERARRWAQAGATR